jgi:hypothetical protein
MVEAATMRRLGELQFQLSFDVYFHNDETSPEPADVADGGRDSGFS